jgi:hypothetical protein
MLKEGCIIIPKRDNSGTKLNWLANDIERKLAETFGGYTRDTAQGGWEEDNLLVRQKVWRYTVAYHSHNKKLDQAIRNIAEWIAEEGGQIRVYYKLASGEVGFAKQQDMPKEAA